MKRKHYLLDLFNGVEDRFVLEALECQEPIRPVAYKKRILLIAAVVAAAMVLIGCASVYFWLQDLSIGTETYTQYYDDQGRALETPIEGERELFAFVGYSDSAANKAAAEWFQFTESYDPEGKLSSNIPDQPEIPNNYERTYGCYTLEMVNQLNQIAAKYKISLLDAPVAVQRWQSEVALREGLGVETLLKPGGQAAMTDVQGVFYPPYNFKFGFDFRLTGEDAAWTDRVWVNEYYFHKAYLPAHGVWSVDLEKTGQWNYTTSDGVTLLLAMDNKGRGFITCQRDDAFQVVSVSGNNTGSAYPAEDQILSKKALEQIAEAFDFSIDVPAIDAQAMKPAMDAAEAKYQEEHAYASKIYGSFEEYMLDTCLWLDSKMVYTLYDLNKDGEQELILGYPQEEIVPLNEVLVIQDGQLIQLGYSGGLCQGNVTVDYTAWEHSAQESWQYWKREFTFEQEDGEYIGTVYHNADGTWQLTTEWGIPEEAPTVTQAEAEAFMEKYKPVELAWQPIANYPLSDGTTIGEYLTSLDTFLSKEDLRKFYADWQAGKKENWNTHYRFMDINDDGVEDILLSGDGKTFREIYTRRYGEIWPLGVRQFYLCEDGIMETVGIRHEEPGVEIEEHEYFVFDGEETVSLDYICYNKSTASWQTDLDGATITEAEAQAIMAKYTRVDQEMLPIGQLIQ